MARRPLSRFETLAVALLVTGAAARLLAFWYRAPDVDAKWYMEMGESLRRLHEFYIPWEGPPTVYTQHFPPAFPALLGLGFALFGTTLTTALAVSVLVGWALIATATLTTWDLYGRAKGLAVGAIIACFPFLELYDTLVMSESMVILLYGLTIWAILKSLDKPRFILLAGLFAGLGYLTKASLGPFFLLAAAGGFAWRFAYVRWKVFTDKWYMAAGAIFLALVVPWAYRNWIRHGNWETQPYATQAVGQFFSSGAAWPPILLASAFWSLVLVALFALAFLPEVARSWTRIRDERTSALWLAVLGPTIIGILFASSFNYVEKWGGALGTSIVRYVITPLLPLLWLAIRDLDLDEPARGDGAPTAGAPMMRRHAMLAAAGVALAALPIGTEVVGPYVAVHRLGALFLLVGVGLALVLASRPSAWSASIRRDAQGRATWRAVHAPGGGGHPLWAIALFVGGVIFLLYGSMILFVYVAAATIALATTNARFRVLAAAAILLAACFTNFASVAPIPSLAKQVNDQAPPGASVSASGNTEFAWTLLRPDLRFIVTNESPDYVIDTRALAEDVPPGYHVAGHAPIAIHFGPGTQAGLWLWGAVFRDVQDVPQGDAGRVFARNATAT